MVPGDGDCTITLRMVILPLLVKDPLEFRPFMGERLCRECSLKVSIALFVGEKDALLQSVPDARYPKIKGIL